MRIPRKTNTSGAALIISLWALLVLSAAIFVWLKFLNDRIVSNAQENRALEAHAAAVSGLTVGLHPLVSQNTAELKAETGPDIGYEVTIVGEAGKWNLNWLLAGENPVKLQMLSQYLASLGLSFEERQKLVDSLLDWVDADDLAHINGAEADKDYRPANRPFLSLDEVRLVKNSRPLVSKVGWEKGFTLLSKGPLDLRYAPMEAIACLPEVGERRAANFLQYRRGADQMDFTEDDPDFKGRLPTMLSFLGIGPLQQKGLNGLVTANEPIFSIVSDGHSGKVHSRIEVVAIKGNGPSKISSWKEY